MVTQLHGANALAPLGRCGFVIFVFTIVCAGCKSLPGDPTPSETAESTADAEASAATSNHSDAPSATSDSPEWTALQNHNWFEQVQLGAVTRTDTFLRWRNQSLERLLHTPPESRPDLSAALASSEEVVAANAAIILARWGSGQPTQQLVAAIGSGELPGNLRCAAAEALGLVQKPSPAANLRELLQEVESQVSRHDDSEEANHELADLQADLVRALARHAEPGDDKWFTAALASGTWNVRLEGILAWIAVPDQPLPAAAVELRNDADPRVRAATLRAICAQRDPRAMEYLQQALGDRSTDVHTTAIAAMGELGSQDAHAPLGQLKRSRSEISRAASVAALAAAGLRGEVESAAKDTSSQVRLAVAHSLAQAKHDGREVAAQTVITAQHLARDASADVQQQAVASLATWPLEQAGPVLLLAIAEGGYAARKTAATQLAVRWPAAADFPVDAAAENRATAIAELKKLWVKQYGQMEEAVVAAKAQAQQMMQLSAERVEQLQALVNTLKQANLPEAARRETITALTAAGPELLSALGRQIDASAGLPPEIYSQVLPGISPAFALLTRLSSKDVVERRGAAAELAVQAASSPLSPLALDRLAGLLKLEKDPVIWQSALAAVAGDPSETASRVAYAAIDSANAEVRRAACDYLGAHGSPRHAAALMSLLNDPDGAVTLAAVRALGSVQTVDDPQPLLRILASPNQALRLEATLSLARLHVAEGVTALERLAVDQDRDIRVRAAKAMGEIADPAFLPELMALLADRSDVQQAAVISLAQVAGSDVVTAQDGQSLSNEERVRRWQLWYRDHQDKDDAKH